jgi:hypothetical protein
MLFNLVHASYLGNHAREGCASELIFRLMTLHAASVHSVDRQVFYDYGRVRGKNAEGGGQNQCSE